MKKLGLILLLLLAFPILLHVYNPSMQLGGFGLLLGMIGMTVSPVILFFTLGAFIAKHWK